MSTISVKSQRHDAASGPSGPGGWSGPSPMEAVESAFGLLGCDPAPLSVDGARVGHGLPARPVPLPELRRFLLDPATPFTARDGVWRVVVRKARRDGPGWVVAATGIALPGLRRLSRELMPSPVSRGKLGFEDRLCRRPVSPSGLGISDLP